MLKNPSHLVALDALMKVYPDALVVYTHRDPVTSIASACSLSAEATAGTSTTFVGETIGRTQLDMLSRSWHTFMDSRPKYDAAQFVDVDYRAFVQDPVGTTRGIYEAFGIEWTPEAAAAVDEIDRESRSGGKRPSHRYDLADYGLTEDEVRASALQFVRKLSGVTHPSRAHEAAFELAVDEVTRAARRLIDSLATNAPPRDREEERRKARERSAKRFGRAAAED